MKTLNKYAVVFGMIAITNFTSCKREYLDSPPETSVSAETSFDTPARVNGQLLSIYSALKSGTFYGGRYQVYGDIRGEDFIADDNNLVTGYDVWTLNLANNSTSVKGVWAQPYVAINRANIFLEGMAAKGTTVVGAALSANYIGEARFIRALSYYSLLQLFAKPYADGAGSKPGVPLRLTSIMGPGESDIARSSVADIYKQVLEDLNFAETAVPVSYSTAYNNTTRIHKNTVIALKTRVYLSMQNYASVITEANKIVPAAAPFVAAGGGVANALQVDVTNVYKSPYTTTESVLSMPFTTTASPLDYPGTQNSLGSYYYQTSSTPGATIYSLNSAGIAGNTTAWPAADKRRTLLFTAGSGKQYVAKYPTGVQYTDYAPVLRWPEVMLNLAEALARTNAGVDARALALVNAVRRRSDATVTLAAATQAELISLIMTERRIEFLGEGLRNIDLMRLLQTIPAKGAAPSKTPAESQYIFPISIDELSLNKLMTDN
jgi:hypothetical protein